MSRLRGKRLRIRRRLALLAAVITTAVVLAFCIPLAIYVRSVAYDRAIDSAELQSRSLAAELVTATDRATIERLVTQANGAAQTQAVVYLANGITVGPTIPAPPLPALVARGEPVTNGGQAGSRLVWEPVRGHGLAQAVMVAVPDSLLVQGVTRDWVVLFSGGAVLVLIALVLADGLGRTIVKPIQALEKATRRLRDGSLDARVVPAGPAEVAEVGRAVNELADRIEELIENARVRSADLGHRLRTPLTSLRLDLERVPPGSSRESLAGDLDELESAVDNLIRETRRAPRFAGHADLVEAVRRRMEFWGVLARSKHRTFTVGLPVHRVEVGLPRDELEAAIDALVSNIFIHTPEGTGFDVSVCRAHPASAGWLLLVSDEGKTAGSGRPDDGGAHGGTGLGLDIVRRSAATAGGDLTIGRTASGGWRVEVRLPEVMRSGPGLPAGALAGAGSRSAQRSVIAAPDAGSNR